MELRDIVATTNSADWIQRYFSSRLTYSGETRESPAAANSPSIANSFPPVPPDLGQYRDHLTEACDHVWNPFHPAEQYRNQLASIHRVVYSVEGKLVRYAHGNGILFPMGSVVLDTPLYDGQWRNGYRHGRGIGLIYNPVGMDVALQGTYTGEWILGKRWGFGVFETAAAGKYIGQWQDDLKHGLGKEALPDGSVYVGSYYQGSRHAVGTFYWAAGLVEAREYSQGALVSKVKLEKPDKSKQEIELDAMCKKAEAKAAELEANKPPKPESAAVGGPSPGILRQVCAQFTDGKVKLKSRKMLREFIESRVTGLADELTSICGSKIAVAVDFDSFTSFPEGHNAIVTIVYENGRLVLGPVREAFSSICKDSSARGTIPEILEGIKIRQSAETTVSVTDKQLIYSCDFSAPSGLPDKKAIVKAIESAE